MITKKNTKLFRTALLNKDESKIAELEKQMLDDGTTAAEIESEKRWAETAYPLVDEALDLRDQGYFTESLKFDNLEKRANKIGMPLPAFLRNLMQSAAAIELEKAQKRKAREAAKPQTTVPKTTVEAAKQNSNVNPSEHPLEFCLAKIRKNAMIGPKGKSKVDYWLSEIQRLYPDAVKNAMSIIEHGNDFFNLKNEAWKLAKEGKSENSLNAIYNKLPQICGIDNNILISQIRAAFNRGKTTNQWEEYRTLEYTDIHPNFLSNLPPSKNWTVLIDEAGDAFMPGATDNLDSLRGRIAAVIVPEDYCQLPDLPPDFHARNLKKQDIVPEVVERIINSPCGVLGISVDAVHSLGGELWYVGVETLIDLILCLLPIDDKTSVKVYAEQRLPFDPQASLYLDTSSRLSLNRLALSTPHRAEMISLSCEFIEKKDHPWNGYVDTVAYCWGGPSVSELLEKSGWINSCLLDFKPEKLCQIVDSILRQTPLNEQEWDDLINRRESGAANTLANALLTIQGQEARLDEKLWNRYLEHVQKHLYSKAINLYALGNQIAWLKKWIPAEATFSPRMRLVWLTTQLAQANHLGQTDMISAYQKEFEDLCTLIYPEDAPLTCLTCLHVAVAYMNDFNFKTAYDVVKGWIDKDEAIPGRLYYGQVLSTIGQLNAFIGKQKEAVEACCAAIDKFEKLTDANLIAGNVNQTSSYKAIAMMDSDPVPENMTTELEKYLGRTLEEAADQFAVSANNNESYMHHVFLRYLVHINEPELKPIIEKYLAHKTEWKTGQYHPWELIEFYRALLHTDSVARKAYLDLAYKQVAQTDDGTLKVIACVILGGLYYYDSSRKEELAELTQKVIDTMPYLGSARITALKNQLETPVEPLTLAKAVLPFNFR